jgi:putative transposase
MARLPRLFAADQPQHIIQRGNNRQAIFHDDADCQRYLGMLSDAIHEHGLHLHAYCLMPNHVHLLATPKAEQSIALVMQALGRRYVRYFNARTKRTGTLWEGRYRSTIIDSEAYFLTCSRYIEMNPMRAGLVDTPAAYPWSSYSHHAGLTHNILITDHPLYWALGNTPFERQGAYLALFEDGLSPAQLSLIRDATNKGWVLGGTDFAQKLEGKTNRRAFKMAKGRPIGSSARTTKKTAAE